MARDWSFTIRAASQSDADGILACLGAAFAEYESSYTPGAFGDTVLDLESMQRRFAEMRVLVAAAADGTITGTIAYKASNTLTGHLRGMAVLPEWQGRGVARDLLAEAENQLRAHGCHRVTLNTTTPLQRAINFYKKHGYHSTGEERDFFGMRRYEYEKAL